MLRQDVPSSALHPLAPGREMSDDLVTVEIEIDPMRVGTAFGATEKAAVKISRGGEIIDRESEMKSWHP